MQSYRPKIFLFIQGNVFRVALPNKKFIQRKEINFLTFEIFFKTPQVFFKLSSTWDNFRFPRLFKVITSQWDITDPLETVLISGFCSVKRMRVIDSPGRNTTPSQVSRQQKLDGKDGKLSQLWWKRRSHKCSTLGRI